MDFNDQVTVGQVLARMDVSKLEAQVKQTQASFQAAKAKVVQAQATINETAVKLRRLEKVRSLSKGKLPAKAEMDIAKAGSRTGAGG